MNKLKQLIDEKGQTPIIPLAGYPGTQLTGVSIKKALTDAHAQADALMALYDQTRPDALFTMMDLTVEAEFLGCSLKFSEDDSPSVSGTLLQDQADVKKIFPNKEIGGRMPLFAEVVERLNKNLDIPVCAYVIGPLTLTGEIMGITRIMKATKKEPELLHQVLANATQIIMNYVALLEAARASLICILEPSAMMISSKLFHEYSGQYCSQIVSNSINGISVLHICGDTNHLIGEMEKVGADGLSLDKQVDFPKVYDSLNPDTVLIGNLDPVSVIAFDTPESIIEKAGNLLQAMKEKRNFILSTGCDVPPNAPIQNIKAMTSLKQEK